MNTHIQDKAKRINSEYHKAIAGAYPSHSEKNIELASKHSEIINNPGKFADQVLYASMAIKRSGILDNIDSTYGFIGHNSEKYRKCTHMDRNLEDVRAISEQIKKLVIEKNEQGEVKDGNAYKQSLKDMLEKGSDKLTQHSSGYSPIVRSPNVIKDMSAISSMIIELASEGKLELTNKASKALEVMAATAHVVDSPDGMWDNHITSAMTVYKERVQSGELKPDKIGIGTYVHQAINKKLTYAGISERII